MEEQKNLDQEILDLERAIAAKLEKPGQRCIIDMEIGLLAAKVVADCTQDRKALVIHLLQLVGFNTTNLQIIEEREKEKQQKPDVGKMIKYATDQCYTTMSKLAKESGVARPALYRYANGKYEPTKKNAEAIIKALKRRIPDIESEYKQTV